MKIKKGKYKDEQEVGLTFMITTAANVQEVCMIISTSKERTKYTVSSAIHRKRHITNHDDDSDDYDGGDVDGGDSDGWKTAIIQHTRTPKRFCR